MILLNIKPSWLNKIIRVYYFKIIQYLIYEVIIVNKRLKFLKIGIIISICTFLLNLGFIYFLPSNVANQINLTTGHLTSYTSKYVFMISLPILELLAILYLYFKREFRTWYYLNFYIIFIFCDVSIIVVNIIYIQHF